MSKKVDDFCIDLRDRLNGVESRINQVKENVDSAGDETQAAIAAKLDTAQKAVAPAPTPRRRR